MADVERILRAAPATRALSSSASSQRPRRTEPLGSKGETPSAPPCRRPARLSAAAALQDSKAPQFTRVGNFGAGVYGNIIDGYELTCAGAKPVVVFMDMYHAGHVEDRPVAGFTIAAAGPIV
jgi:hypothetical protein